MVKRQVAAIAFGLIFVGIVAVALRSMSAIGESSLPAAVSSPTYQQGAEHVPSSALVQAIDEFNAEIVCGDGRLDKVTVSGATTFGDIDALLPKLGIGRASPNIAASVPIYGAVVQGDCTVENEEEPYKAVQGYFLFTLIDGQLRMVYGRVWLSGFEPELDAPFGPRTDDGLAI